MNSGKYNFSTVNVTYILEAQRLILEDRPMAKIVLRLPDEIFNFIEELNQEKINLISQLKAPLPSLNINQKIFRELMRECKNNDVSDLNAFNDRLMLANA